MFEKLKADGLRREEAWADFRKRYAPVIAGFARRCSGSRKDIEDIVQG